VGFLNECVSFGGTVFIIGEMGVSDRYACFKAPECAEQPLVSIGNAATYQITLITVVLDRGERSGSTEIVLGEMGLHPEKTSYECFIEPPTVFGLDQNVLHFFVFSQIPGIIVDTQIE
jgi:hypothetical protein